MLPDTSDILARLRSRTRRIQSVTLPGSEITVGLVVLTQAEHQEATAGTDRYFLAKKVEVGKVFMVDAWNAEMSTQVLARALVEPESGEAGKLIRVVKTADQLRETLTVQEQSFLLDRYLAHPDYEVREAVDDAKLKELAAEVKKSPEVLNSLDSASLRRLVLCMAARP
jgi:hypothetical protein